MIEYKYHIGQHVNFIKDDTLYSGIIQSFIIDKGDYKYNVLITSRDNGYIQLTDQDIVGYFIKN